MTDVQQAVAVVSLVTDVLERLAVPHTIGGSIASSIAGEPRSTLDIDVVAALTAADVSPFTAQVVRAFYVDEGALRRAVATAGSANLIHHATSIKVDLFVAGGTPLDMQQIGRRMRVDVAGRTLYVHPPEDILLQKLRWFRKGGEVSDRQWRDILGIVRVQGERLDRDYVRRNAPVLGVEDLAERVLGR